MGTYALITALYRHWGRPVNPVYRNDQRGGPPWRGVQFERWIAFGLRAGLFIGFVTLVFVALRTLTEQGVFWSLSTLMLQLVCLSAVAVLIIVLMLLTFFWPLAVSIMASSTIVREREQRTWAALLTTPLDWGDLLTAKLASTLHWLRRPLELMVWMQGIWLALTLLLVIAQTEKVRPAVPAWMTVALSVAAGVQFAFARVQDYSAASLIGLAASMFSESRQTASVLALLVSLGALILRLLITAFFIALAQLNPSPPPQGLLILLGTGPTSAIALALSRTPLLAFAVLIGVAGLREAAIRLGYRYVLRHLGTATGNG